LQVDVPAGIHDGQRIRLSGEGHAGTPGGRAGDVYVRVGVEPDPRFVREGNDVYSQVDLTIVQASLGASVPVETLDGTVELELEPGVQPGEVRVLRGKGMPVLQGFGRGDHRVLVNVSVPRRLTDEQRRLLEEFDAASDDQTYRHDESFFEKLKSAFR
jgi:molecular chaperone DnaJ